jgi:tRNA pseudouridine38-40 synthase
MRFKLVIEYDGSEYHGWQLQPNGRTVQAVLEDAVRRMRGESVRIVAAGRTDAGVHASGQVIALSLSRAIAPDVLARGLDALTPTDISVRSAEVVDDAFDPRRGASSRVYVYRIWNAAWPSPFWRRYAWHLPHRLDVGRMQAAARTLIGEHDFTTFRAAGCEARHAVRHVVRSEVHVAKHLIVHTIEANAFVRSMVRNIVGTLAEVGSGRRSVEDVAVALQARDRARAGATAPAHGLCLTEVRYEAGAEPRVPRGT